MKIIFTCGGTGGHINPAIAVAKQMQERHPDCEILFVGCEMEMEEKLVPQAGFRLVTIPGSGLARGFSWADIKFNARAMKFMMQAVLKVKKIIRDFKPDVIMGTGGYASFAALYVGSMMGIPTCVHESNATPGLTTKIVANRADRIMVNFAESAAHYKHKERVEVVGMPVRREFIYNTRAKARAELGIGEEPLVVSAFGSLGATAMNKAVAEMFKLERADNFPFRHVHATGSYGWDSTREYIKNAGIDVEKCPKLEVLEYIYNMPTLMAAADVIIGRAGASSCNEIAVTGTPCILIPSPNVTDNHQEKNARVLESRGGAVLILEKDCTSDTLYATIKALLADPARCEGMRKALQGMVIPDSAEQICQALEKLAKA